MRITPLKNNGTYGEITPELAARVDTVAYNNGFKRLRNAIAMPFGGTKKRPGTYFVNGVKTKSLATRLIRFLFSNVQAYILELGNQYIRFYKDNGRIEVTGTPTEVTTPFITANLDNIQYTQDADVMIFCDGINKPFQLTRNSHTSWSTQAIFPINLIFVGIAVSGGTWTESVANAQDNNIATRSAGNIGAYVGRDFGAELKNVRQIRIYGSTGATSLSATLTLKYSDNGSTWTNTNIVSQVINIDSAWNSFYVNDYGQHRYWAVFCEANSKFMEVEFYEGSFNWYSPVMPDNQTNISLTPSAQTGSITLTASSSLFQSGHVGSMWRIGASGYVVITGYTSGTVVTAIVKDTLASTSATIVWAEGAWSSVRGYPSCVTYHNQRLYFACTTTQPQTIWYSKIGDYSNFKVGTVASDGGSYSLAGTQKGKIEWLYSDKDLIVGTSTDVFGFKLTVKTATEASLAEIVSGDSFGCCNIAPVKIGSYLYYVQNDKTTIRQMAYNYAIESYGSEEISLFSSHLFKGTIKSIVYQKSPYSMLWVLLTDGTIAVLVRQIEQEVKGWSLFDTQGLFESVSSIPNGSEDQMWIIANRTIQSITERYIEYFKPFNYGSDISDAFFLDSGLTAEGVSMTTISGLDHLEGKTVAVLADGAVRSNKTVTSGSITL